jgi:hypothetical protein
VRAPQSAAADSTDPMGLLEYQGKRLFKKHGVPVPDGRHAANVPEAVGAAEALGANPAGRAGRSRPRPSDR